MNKKQEDYLLYRLAQSLSLNNPLKYEEIHHMITSEYEDLSDDEMTDKRFEIFPQNVAKDGTLIIIQKGLKLYNISDVVDLLNALHEENEQLKQFQEKVDIELLEYLKEELEK